MRQVAAILVAFAMFIGTAASVRAACAPGVAELRGLGKAVRFSVELAATPAERAQGLMFRESLAKSAGMLFVFERPGRVAFWMRNTLIPLDMIFLDAAGVVTRVHANAVPRDETPIEGGEAVLGVLEINGGLARRLQIAPGWELRHPAMPQAGAAWPCD